jgi:hypothetical protein
VVLGKEPKQWPGKHQPFAEGEKDDPLSVENLERDEAAAAALRVEK